MREGIQHDHVATTLVLGSGGGQISLDESKIILSPYITAIHNLIEQAFRSLEK